MWTPESVGGGTMRAPIVSATAAPSEALVAASVEPDNRLIAKGMPGINERPPETKFRRPSRALPQAVRILTPPEAKTV